MIMGKILEAFAEGNFMMETSLFKNKPAYRKIINMLCDLGDQLEEMLGQEGKALLERYNNALADEGQLYATERFIRGYCLGALMMIELFSESDGLIMKG